MNNYFLFFLILLFAKENLWAQDRFSVNSPIGCAPFTVEVTEDTDITGSSNTLYRYGDGSGWVETTTHEYQQPGTYVLEQHVDNDLLPGGKVSSTTITVVAGEEPKYEYYLCNDRQIFVTVTDETYPAYYLNLGDGTTPTINTNQTYSHTYANTAPKVISVTGLINDTKTPGHASNNNCGVNKVTIIPLDDLPVPTLNQISILSPDRIEIRYNVIENLQYQLEISTNGSTGFTEIGIPSTSGSFIAEGLDTENNFYCFRLALKDPCDNTIPDVHSNIICSATTSVTAENNQNSISWNNEANNLQNIQLFRNNTLYATIDANQSSFVDNDILCNENYCYEIRLNYIQGFSTNENICVIGITQNSPPAIENATVSISDNDILLEWQEPSLSVKEYHVEKSQEDGNYTSLISTETEIYLDKDVDITTNFHCYKIFYEDECGNIAPLSRDICPVLLTVTENENHSYELTWTQYSGWEEGVSHYLLDKIDKEGNVIETILINSGTNSYIDDDNSDERQIILYRITAVSNNDANWLSHSNIVRMEKEIKVFLPSAFTPNGDQLNDVFIAKGTFIKELHMKIFNRWGELLFFSNDKTVGWDGNFRGSPVQEGSYVYSIQVTDYNDKTISLSGAFMLIRNRKN